jgi:hypothetical protein
VVVLVVVLVVVFVVLQFFSSEPLTQLKMPLHTTESEMQDPSSIH